MSADRSPVTLASLGDVLTDADLARLCQRAPSWPRRERDRARHLGVTPDLPPRLPQFKRPRYHAAQVAIWLKTGSISLAMRRSA